GEKIGIGHLDQRLEGVDFVGRKARQRSISEAAENEIHFAGAAVPGAVAEATEAWIQSGAGKLGCGHAAVMGRGDRPSYGPCGATMRGASAVPPSCPALGRASTSLQRCGLTEVVDG